MDRRFITFGVAAVLLIGMLFAINWLPVPYVVLSPGPVTDTLGAVPSGDGRGEQSGGPVIRITGVETRPTDGHLYLTTVALHPGDCDVQPRLVDALRAWFNSHQTVEPQQVRCPPGVSSEAVRQQGATQMSRSQKNAIYAAMTELGYEPTGTAVVVEAVAEGLPAESVLEREDVILAVAGQRISKPQQLVNAVQRVTPGDHLSLTVERNDVRKTLDVGTAKGPGGKARLGIEISSRPLYDGINVSIDLDPAIIGGPSAGAALALGIVDKLIPGGLTGGRTIAGTGTISKQGKVGPIGGIQQKIAAAADAGATVFFTPASECTEAKAAAPSSLTLVSIETLHGAVAALRAIKSGSSAFPHC